MTYRYQIAREYLDAGISVIPVRADGSKAPKIPAWKQYQKSIATDDECRSWFVDDDSEKGIAIVCGVVSRGLEVLDFDDRANETFSAWRAMLSPSIRGRLCVVETGGLGCHVIYRANEVCGNYKIAMSADGGVLIESRGEGGYIVAVGSPATVHSSGSPYVQVAGQPLPDIPHFTLEERKQLWKMAATFDERTSVIEDFVRVRSQSLRTSGASDHDTPWGDFDRKADWAVILEPSGWTTTDGIGWTRPGKSFGLSAKVVTAESGDEVLTVFSGNAGPLAPMGTGHRSWGKFGAFTALNYGGDRSEAAKAVIELGYGRRKNTGAVA